MREETTTARRGPPNPAPNKPPRLQTVREATGASTAQKAGEQEQRVNIGAAAKRNHNL